MKERLKKEIDRLIIIRDILKQSNLSWKKIDKLNDVVKRIDNYTWVLSEYV